MAKITIDLPSYADDDDKERIWDSISTTARILGCHADKDWEDPEPETGSPE